MENFGYVKKYKPLLCLILSNVINLLVTALLFYLVCDNYEYSILFWSILGVIQIGYFLERSIDIFISQSKFNKTNSYCFTLLYDGSLLINGKTIDFDNVDSISYYKTRVTIFGDSKRNSSYIKIYSSKNSTYYQPRTTKAEERYDKKASKISTGNIIVRFKDSMIVLKRICDIESVVNKLKKIFNDEMQV